MWQLRKLAQSSHRLAGGVHSFLVASYGTARQVKLPAPSGAMTCPFGTPYSQLLDTIEGLDGKAQRWFSQRKITPMLERNIGIKSSPLRWQAMSEEEMAAVDVAVTFEERVFDALNEDVLSRAGSGVRPLHVINLDTRDDPDAAKIGAGYAHSLVMALCDAVDRVLAKDPAGAEERAAVQLGSGELPQEPPRVRCAQALQDVVHGVIASLHEAVMAPGSLVPLHMQHAA